MPLFLHISNAHCVELTAIEEGDWAEGSWNDPNAKCNLVSKTNVVDIDHLLNFL